MESVFLSLGSNMGERMHHLERALELLQEPQVLIRECSSIYETEPVGFKDQANFLNLVCKVETSLSPPALLEACKRVESAMGRRALQQNGPRLIDLDILFFGGLRWTSKELRIPHASVSQRRFVLVPLAEIAPDFRDPTSGRTVMELLLRCPDRSWVRRLESG